MRRLWYLGLICLTAGLLTGCVSSYSPNTYSGNAVQLANKVEAGVVIGFREVAITTSGNIGAVTGGAAGGVLGAEYANSPLVAVGATAVGGILGNAMDHAVGDTTGWEYIIRKPSGDMLSVTQREKKPLGLGAKVLVIMGPQARVVPDYSVGPEQPPAVVAAAEDKKPEALKMEPVKVEVVLSLPPGVSLQPTAEVSAAKAFMPEDLAEQSPQPRPAPLSVAELLSQLDLTADDGRSCDVNRDGLCPASPRQ